MTQDQMTQDEMTHGEQLDNLTAVIMAGGAGTRFWPVSTEGRPKQFLALLGERTLLQQSYDRLATVLPGERILVLTAARFVDLVREQLPELPPENVVGEPMRRDTAAAVALGVALCEQREGDSGLMAVLTSDHLIHPVERFHRDLRSAVRGAAASDGALYTFGIQPAYAASSYGYLQRGRRIEAPDDEVQHFRVRRFCEKPDAETARRYLDSGEYYWNSGMFVWQVAAVAAELERHLPRHLEALRPAVKANGTAGFGDVLAKAFEPLEATSIDFGVMEKANDVRCVASGFDWNDVGGWQALEQFLAHDGLGNAHRGQLHTREARDNIVFCEDPEEHVALIGVDGLVVVRSGDRTLVVPTERAEEIKQLVKELDPALR